MLLNKSKSIKSITLVIGLFLPVSILAVLLPEKSSFALEFVRYEPNAKRIDCDSASRCDDKCAHRA